MVGVLAFHGTIIHCTTPTETKVLKDTLLVVTPDGRISHIKRGIPESDVQDALSQLQLPELPILRVLSQTEFLIPGFVDTHNHAPQWAQRGLGGGMHILDWLEQITFPNEAKFEDPEHARK
ncbi:hypothetical protein LTS06_012396, partial [Exophiala xenobiotica]